MTEFERPRSLDELFTDRWFLPPDHSTVFHNLLELNGMPDNFHIMDDAQRLTADILLRQVEAGDYDHQEQP